MSRHINKGLEWALTKDAKRELEKLVELGMDYDLAYAILEREWSEQELYDLPEDD